MESDQIEGVGTQGDFRIWGRRREGNRDRKFMVCGAGWNYDVYMVIIWAQKSPLLWSFISFSGMVGGFFYKVDA